jgi:hypothetical protein
MTLVIKSWHVVEKPKDGIYVRITARAPGLVSWALSLLGVDATTTFTVLEDQILYESGSWSGHTTVAVALNSITRGYYGYEKPWKEALIIGGILLPVFGLGLIVGPLYYFLNKNMQLGFVEKSGRVSTISFKRSIIEGQTIDENSVQKILILVRALIEISKHSKNTHSISGFSSETSKQIYELKSPSAMRKIDPQTSAGNSRPPSQNKKTIIIGLLSALLLAFVCYAFLFFHPFSSEMFIKLFRGNPIHSGAEKPTNSVPSMMTSTPSPDLTALQTTTPSIVIDTTASSGTPTIIESSPSRNSSYAQPSPASSPKVESTTSMKPAFKSIAVAPHNPADLLKNISHNPSGYWAGSTQNGLSPSDESQSLKMNLTSDAEGHLRGHVDYLGDTLALISGQVTISKSIQFLIPGASLIIEKRDLPSDRKILFSGKLSDDGSISGIWLLSASTAIQPPVRGTFILSPQP